MSPDDIYKHDSSKKDYGSKVKRSFYFAGGTFCLILGAVGVFLPILFPLIGCRVLLQELSAHAPVDAQ